MKQNIFWHIISWKNIDGIIYSYSFIDENKDEFHGIWCQHWNHKLFFLIYFFLKDNYTRLILIPKSLKLTYSCFS